jgi:LysM repeat protein
MIKRYALALIIIIGSAALLYQQAAAKEDTAQITLKKTAVSRKNLYTYTVKKGDILSAIVRYIPGITEQDISNNYQIIKELNPDLADLDKLNPGQLLVLPGKSSTEEKKVTTATAIPSAEAVAPTTASTISQPYTIKKGDSLIKIIYRELKIKTNIQKTLKFIKSMNPNIADVNKIYTGAIINLPGKTLFVSAPEETKSAEQEVVKLAEKTTPPEKIIEVKEKKVMTPEARIAVIKQVITQMNGSLITTGNYYLPLPKTGQVIIDCSKIPVIEFDDKTTVFLDLENRADNNLKKIISDNWTNYYLVKVENNDDVISILKKVINATKGYNMTKRENPTTIGVLPPVEIIVDWMIVKAAPKQALPLMQGLRLVYENNLLLPKAVKNYSQKNGLIITEISEETGLVGKPEEIYSLPPMPVFPTTSAKDFSYALVSNLGLSADKDADIKIFDTAKDGFNLSIKADVLVKYQNKKYIIYSRNLSQQFINVLKKAGNEIIFVADNDPPKNIMEKILRSFNISFASGNFTFSGIDKNQAPYTLNFSGTKIKTDKDLYVIDFNIDHELRGLLKEAWSANIAKY